ncbi:uncharacterized protein SPSK_06376 [Sporothrix schenckii 1099-18]|uniref:DUF1746 domain-containing protein n=2 Tax=Sporothrix schenckii TaxID=29908 RepID=U7PSM8_SPOS1|nr:uncharacterized protein SPSK_06376 [Sporothrix schenckii 1099-18]ERS98607.1 hypothetical protein HMPREF1624_05394 [Sporothrix schenckii ATCC 58251]KJR89215.1 hypothetical protein SPSK_06376 [Sporothrix schenckii 1099-18]
MNSSTDAGGGASGSGNARSSHRTRRSRANTATRARSGYSSALAGKVRESLKKKLAFYTDMMSQLDMLVFAELCALYYMDCSFFRFVIRAAPHSFFLSPKPEDFAIPLDARKPHLVAIFAPNFLCLLAHSLGSLPRATEANRGYLHGGVMIDFVGQKAPTSALALVALDLVVLVVQCLMLAMHTEREKLRRLVSPIRSVAANVATAAATRVGGLSAAGGTAAANAAANATPAAAPTIQEQDAAERGAAQQAPGAEDGAGSAPAASNGNSEPDEDERLHNIDLGGPLGAATPEEAVENALDSLSSGGNIGDFYIIHAIRRALQEKDSSAAAQSLQSIGYAVTLARLAAERRTRARMNAQQRPQ